MATLQDGDIVESVTYTSYGSQIGAIVRHWVIGSTTGAGGTDQALVNVLSAAIGPPLKALMNNQAVYQKTRLAKILPLPRLAFVESSLGFGNGGVGGDILPQQSSGLISLRSQLAGRAHRGRAFIPFPSETDSNIAGVPALGYQTNLQAMGVVLATSYVFGNAPDQGQAFPAIYHRVTFNVTQISGFVIRVGWATQRRRGTFGRPNVLP
jgi:hypothetical protein